MAERLLRALSMRRRDLSDGGRHNTVETALAQAGYADFSGVTC